ncbi:MAG: hypothetical protein ACLUOI_16685 [Eisenbergiella sp.]
MEQLCSVPVWWAVALYQRMADGLAVIMCVVVGLLFDCSTVFWWLICSAFIMGMMMSKDRLTKTQTINWPQTARTAGKSGKSR